MDGGVLWWFGSLLLVCIALGAGLYVLRNIFREGRERRRSNSKNTSERSPGESSSHRPPGESSSRRSPEDSPYRGQSGKSQARGDQDVAEPGEASDGKRSDVNPENQVVCQSCGAVNKPTYDYCQECVEEL